MSQAKAEDRYTVCIFLHSGSYERVHSALTIANVALAMRGEVHMLFSYGALRRLVKGRTDDPDAHEPLGETLRNQMQTGQTRSLHDMIALGKRFGRLHLWACAGSMALLNIARDELIDETDGSMGLAQFMETARQATTVLYI